MITTSLGVVLIYSMFAEEEALPCIFGSPIGRRRLKLETDVMGMHACKEREWEQGQFAPLSRGSVAGNGHTPLEV